MPGPVAEFLKGCTWWIGAEKMNTIRLDKLRPRNHVRSPHRTVVLETAGGACLACQRPPAGAFFVSFVSLGSTGKCKQPRNRAEAEPPAKSPSAPRSNRTPIVRYAEVSMPEGSFQYVDVSVPAPLDQPFTYSLPETLRHRVRPGSRIVVPFGPRKLTGVILRCHDDPPNRATREALRLIDSEPVLDAELLSLGRWIAGYYCAPLGDVLRGMLPLASEIRRGKVWSLTDSGRDAARQLLLDAAPDDPVARILRMLERRPLSAAYLSRILPLADKAIRSLERKGLIAAEQVQTERDPLRAPAGRLRVELAGAPAEGKLNKPERELKAFLELHPGSHNLKDLESMLAHSSAAARSLARKGVVTLAAETAGLTAGAVRTPHTLNPAQQAAYDAIRTVIDAREFCAFLLYGVTGSGKTEIYLNAIQAVVARDAARCCWCRKLRSRPPWPASSSRASATALPFCTARSPTWNGPSSGAASAPARLRWWWAPVPACSRPSATWG